MTMAETGRHRSHDHGRRQLELLKTVARQKIAAGQGDLSSCG